MGYASLRECVDDLERTRQLVRIGVSVDANLEAAAIHRRVYAAGGPAVLFERVAGCDFPMVSNLFGTLDRARFLFRDTLETVRRFIELKADPADILGKPWRLFGLPFAAWHGLPKRVGSGPVLHRATAVSRLPQLKCWPMDGGAFVTLPLVYSEDPALPGWRRSNLGMYRVQLSGNQYRADAQVGLHYQIHRGIGFHHARALTCGKPFRVNIFVGGPPALTLSAVMPLPEGLPEVAFAGILGGRRVKLAYPDANGPAVAADADFCIRGTVGADTLPEGPFGDHLGYYSLAHPFPVLNVETVTHRPGAIWPFTVVGRPPQEDTTFGELIHEITGPAIPAVVPGVHAVHAVDAAGVHPLLLAIGSERYVPYAAERKPQELLTAANAILGQGQLSLAKYLMIVAKEDAPDLDVHDMPAFFRHLLERVDWRADLHFQTSTTIDTLDYSGTGLNEGSKVVVAAAGPKRRALATAWPAGVRLPQGFDAPHLVLPGVVAVTAPAYAGGGERAADRFCESLASVAGLEGIPLIVLTDDSAFASARLGNWLWVTFTRSNPAADIGGVRSFTRQKHWGCEGPLVIDARIKPHHAPALEEDPGVSKRVEALAARGGPLHGLF